MQAYSLSTFLMRNITFSLWLSIVHCVRVFECVCAIRTFFLCSFAAFFLHFFSLWFMKIDMILSQVYCSCRRTTIGIEALHLCIAIHTQTHGREKYIYERGRAHTHSFTFTHREERERRRKKIIVKRDQERAHDGIHRKTRNDGAVFLSFSQSLWLVLFSLNSRIWTCVESNWNVCV